VDRPGSVGTFPLYQWGRAVKGSITLTVVIMWVMKLHELVCYVVTTTTEQYSASILYPKMVENLSSP
jgi:hypothetical protein